ncbi:MAG: I78 family peptidase inhibitor [Erythrobacter sp.]
MRQTAIGIAITGILAAGLSACVVNIGDEAPNRAEAVPPPPVPMVCNAAAAQGYVGKEATQPIGEAILRDSGARTLRWGAPNAAWTMDYRQDRVNVRYDANMTIIDITCG